MPHHEAAVTLLLVAVGDVYPTSSSEFLKAGAGFLRVWFDVVEYRRKSLRRNQRVLVVELTETGAAIKNFVLWGEFMNWAVTSEHETGHPLSWRVREGNQKVWANIASSAGG